MQGKRVESGMIWPYVQRYLEKEDPKLDEVILSEMMKRFMDVTYRQFMEAREEKQGSYPSGGATKCPRHNALKLSGAPSDPIDAKTRIKFWMGDLAELGLLGLIQLAYKDTPHSIGENNVRLEIMHGSEGNPHRQTHGGYTDGLLNFNHEYHLAEFGVDLREQHGIRRDSDGLWPSWCREDETLIPEFKSAADYPINGGGKSGQGFRNVGPDDTFGYLGQVTNYQRHLEIFRYVFIYMWKDTAEILTHVGLFDPSIAEKIDRNHDLVYSCLDKGTIPPVPEDANHGLEPNRNGLKLKLNCRFCAVKKACYDALGYDLEEVQGRPYMGKPTNPNYFARRRQGEGGGIDTQAMLEGLGKK